MPHRLFPGIDSPRSEPRVALHASHERLLTFTLSLLHVATLPDLAHPSAPVAAGRARRYFVEGLPLHTAYEDLSLAARLRVAVPESGPLLDELQRDHQQIDACLATLLPLLGALAEGRAVPATTFREAVRCLTDVLLPHIRREKNELVPLCCRLSVADGAAVASEMVERRSYPDRPAAA
ncbi:MAG: hemerythrin domain-containing protein [Pseudomonadota bacterium]|nr:hemerythrin domain-containing protein [Pseudomonadota bacterium]